MAICKLPTNTANAVYLIESYADLASIDLENESQPVIGYILNGQAYIYDGERFTAYDDFDPAQIFPLAYSSTEYTDDDSNIDTTLCTPIAYWEAEEEATGDDEDNAEEEADE